MPISELVKLPPMVGALGMLIALILYFIVKKYPEGDDAVKKIGDQIHLGAMVFMKREYKMLTMFLAVVVLAAWTLLGQETGIAVIVGAVSSSSQAGSACMPPPKPMSARPQQPKITALPKL